MENFKYRSLKYGVHVHVHVQGFRCTETASELTKYFSVPEVVYNLPVHCVNENVDGQAAKKDSNGI